MNEARRLSTSQEIARNVSPIIRSPENNIVPATKSIIETHVAENAIRIIEIIIKKYYNIVHYTTETM